MEVGKRNKICIYLTYLLPHLRHRRHPLEKETINMPLSYCSTANIICKIYLFIAKKKEKSNKQTNKKESFLNDLFRHGFSYIYAIFNLLGYNSIGFSLVLSKLHRRRPRGS